MPSEETEAMGERLCGAIFNLPPSAINPVATSRTYSAPITCKLPVDHDDPMHRAGEVSWPTAEYEIGRADVEGTGVQHA